MAERRIRDDAPLLNRVEVVKGEDDNGRLSGVKPAKPVGYSQGF